MKQLFLIFYMIFSISSCGCSYNIHNNGDKQAKVEIITKGNMCQRTEPSAAAVWVDNSLQLADFYKQINKNIIGSLNTPVPEIDFSKSGVLIIMMGQKSTGGFSLNIRDEKPVINKDKLILYIDWIEPPKKALLPQMISSPYMMLKLKKQGYSKIDILDQNKILRIRLNKK